MLLGGIVNAWQIAHFGPDGLAPASIEQRAPGTGEVALAPLAVSLNYRDWMVLNGWYNPRQPLPLVPCSDAVARVTAVGQGVTSVSVGDRVCPLFSQTWVTGPPTDEGLTGALGGPLPGTLRTHMVAQAQAVVPAPEHLSDVEAACLPCAAVTAWRSLVTIGGIGKHSTVLTLGTGGVSLFALQIAKMLGARVAITSSSDDKLDQMRSMGADFTVNYRTDTRWGKAVRQWSGGGVDCVVEVGGAGTLDQSLSAVRTGGTIAMIGVLDGGRGPIALTKVLMRSVRIQGIFVGNRSDFEGLNSVLSAHPDVRPVVSKVFPIEQAPEAFAALARGEQPGKIVVRIGGG